MARHSTAAAVALGAAVTAATLAGVGLSLALVQVWGRRLPQRLLGWAAMAAASVLTIYGGLLIVVGGLALLGVFGPPPSDPTALRWHVMVWDLWFLLWGLFLGTAVWQRRHLPTSQRAAFSSRRDTGRPSRHADPVVLLPRVDGLAWDHNADYHRLVLSRLPIGSSRVLDAGCGAGLLTAKLGRRVPYVDAVDRDAGMVQRARLAAGPGVFVRQADLLTDPLPEAAYDAVVSLSALHHLPLGAALPRLATALRPGGRLIAVALPRVELPRDLPVEMAAVGAQAAVAVALGLTRLAGLPALVKVNDSMPVIAPELTVRQVRRQAQAVLPGARVRRLLFWRYLLEWDPPTM